MIFEWIEEGPDLDAFMQRYESIHNQAPPASVVRRHVSEWQRDRLSLVIRNSPRALKEKYDSLVNEYGPARSFIEPDYRLSGISWSGSRSPKSVEDLDKLSTKDLVEFLRDWEEEDPFLGPSREGLLDTFSDLVSMKPAGFVEELALVKLLPIDYLSALLTGIHKALEQENAFSWEHALELFTWVIEQSQTVDEEHIGQSDSPQRQSRKRILSILSTGMNSSSELMIPFNLRTDVWKILDILAKDPDPTPVDEENLNEQNMDPVMLSINTVRGKALHSVVHYALWVRNHVGDEVIKADEISDWFGFMPEVQDVLDAHLKIENDPSLAIRAVFGQWFPHFVSLDKTWAQETVLTIFQAEPRMIRTNTGLLLGVPISSSMTGFIKTCLNYCKTNMVKLLTVLMRNQRVVFVQFGRTAH